MVAVGNPNIDVINSVIRAGADVNVADTYGVTALIDASENPNVAVTEALIFAGANVNAAESNRNVAVTEALIHAGANVNQKDTSGLTALDYAQRSSIPNPHVIQVIVRAGGHSGH